MTNTHRKTTTRTTAKIAAVGAFGIGAAIAFPGLAAAQDATTPESPTASLADLTAEDGSLADLTGDDGSLEGALGTALELDLGSLALNVNLDAETPNPGSVELGSLGVSPNTGSAVIDGDSGSGSAEDETATAAEEEPADGGSLGSLTGGSAGDEETAEGDAPAESTGSGSAAGPSEDTDDDAMASGLLDVGSLAGLSSGAGDDAAGDDEAAAATTGSLG